MAIGEKPRPLVQLFGALQTEGIRFMLAGMSAANLQGVLQSTIDVDIWIGLPPRQYMRVINVCRRLGATLKSPNKVYLNDNTPIDFIYEVTGLRTFDWEFQRAERLLFHGVNIPVLPLKRICRSKQAVGRDKDKLHILLIKQALRLKRASSRPRQSTKASTLRKRRGKC